ncbi:peptidoglycan-associated lipoprotein Pal [Leucothrix arctica]|uniref:Peptidoglycan-associated lipoprotein n=1 Tax=Leucothrix arctica TaxID=1481894 RepID=A0A317C8D4_9GAMM|nr:peptidoglycan-associated lipoprotein Pal [Leucothrix arctica]PWQ94557.1 peptidoglycan-associated lipoprotein Pal [Leucothrix arctica]
MKPIKWMIPLVAVSVLVLSGCSQMQQKVETAEAGNRITTGTGANLSGRTGVTTAGNALRGSSALGNRSTSSFGGASSSTYGDGRGNLVNGIGSNGSSPSTTGLGGSGIGGSNSSSFGASDNRLGGSGGDYKVTDLNDSNSILSRRVIYFAYDQSTIEPEYFEILDAHSELLASNPNLTVRLEGHADERGSREYNVALSERRAQSVKQFMDLKGVGSEQNQTVAYGEELPVDPGHTEAAWSKNRRVEIKYIGR